ncbi:50S ribosomal protein L25 [Candidatus Saccharibacteria bacterium]|nr:50S ribosomal protein L25 [Candidatus Saccharibacteria bacterium]
MPDKITLGVEKRTATGKQVAKIRHEGQVPAVVYGSAVEPQNVQLPQNAARKVVREAGRHTPVELTLDGKKQIALIKSIDYAPARHDITHISFQAVRADEVVTTEVPLELVGVEESEAAKAGLIILPTLESVEVRAKTADLPSEIIIDATQLSEPEEKLTMLDAQIPDGVEVVDFDPEQVIATVWEPAALEAKNAAADKAADEARAAEAEGTEAAENVPSEQEEKSEEKAE